MMSSSYSPALAGKPSPEVRPFLYVDIAAEEAGSASATISSLAATEGHGPETPEQREAAAREAGRHEGEMQARAQAEQQATRFRESLATAVTDFAHQRADYFRQVESEVVQLTLAIARRILHRETHIDPQLLPALVRFTLEKMESGTQVVVRMNPREVSECRGYFAGHMEPSLVPEVVEDTTVEPGRCVLQTALGTTQLGVEVQLKEIEQGLFDLLEKRPAGA